MAVSDYDRRHARALRFADAAASLPPARATGLREACAGVLRRPAIFFAVVSILFGCATIALTPPLRGPDEAAHFLRAYGIAQGEIVARTADERGRKGIFLPADLYRDFRFFDDARERFTQDGGGYAARMAEFRAMRAATDTANDGPVSDAGAAFAPYSGSEGYSPVPYLPYSAAALLGRGLGWDFVTTLYAMRAAGLALSTAIAAAAIALAPRLRWMFLAVAMLPAALYGRSVVSADALTISATLLAIALCLRAGLGLASAPAARAFSFAVSALCKPPQIAFCLLEAMARDWRLLPRGFVSAILVAAPGVLIAVLWALVAGTDSAGWRLYESSTDDPAQFDPGWKLAFLLAHPLHFPRVLFGSLDYVPELARQAIGVLGWLDAPLRGWGYVAIAALLATTALQPLAAGAAVRLRLAGTTLTVAIVYALAVCLIFFLAYTPTDSTRILGLQGRYFIGVLPLLAIAAAAAIRRGVPDEVAAAAGVGCALLSGLLVCDALLQADWRG